MTAPLNDASRGEQLPVPGALLTYWPRIRLPVDHDALLAELIGSTPWRHDRVTVFGKSHLQPRLTAWYGDAGAAYRYAGLDLDPLPWTPLLTQIRRAVETTCGAAFNSVLLNYYRNGHDSMGMHADDEPELGARPVIASLSLGVTRTLTLKHRHDGAIAPVRLPLPPSSLLVMAGNTQQNWKHGIAKSRRIHGARINLTFRRIIAQQRSSRRTVSAG